MMPVPGRSRADRDLAGAEVALAVMVQRAAVAQRNADHRLLGGRGRLGDGFRHFARLAVTEAGAALAVADHDQRGEAEALAALHGLRDAVDVDELLDQLLAAFVVAATAAATVVATATAAATIVAATAATAATDRAGHGLAALRQPLGCGGSSRSGFGRGASTGRSRRGFDLRGFVFVSHLELQSAFAGGIGQGLHPAMEQEAATVEHDRGHAGLLGALGQGLADLGRAVAGRAGLALDVLVQGRSRDQRLAGGIVDDLGVDVLARTVDRQARLARGARASAVRTRRRRRSKRESFAMAYFFLPSLRKIYSPRYLMPLPL